MQGYLAAVGVRPSVTAITQQQKRLVLSPVTNLAELHENSNSIKCSSQIRGNSMASSSH